MSNQMMPTFQELANLEAIEGILYADMETALNSQHIWLIF